MIWGVLIELLFSTPGGMLIREALLKGGVFGYGGSRISKGAGQGAFGY